MIVTDHLPPWETDADAGPAPAPAGAWNRFHRANSATWWGVVRYWLVAPAVGIPAWWALIHVFAAPFASLLSAFCSIYLTLATVVAVIYGCLLPFIKGDSQ